MPSLPPTAGVIIPLLAELDPANPSELFMNWDMARCLKWGYADKISMRKVFMSELSVAASQVEVPADANIMAATIMAAAKVRHSQLPLLWCAPEGSLSV